MTLAENTHHVWPAGKTLSRRKFEKWRDRAELPLSIIIETMRREGFELQVSKPEVIYKRGENGELLEPMEMLLVDIPEDKMGPVMEMLGNRKGEMINMGPNGPGQLLWNLKFQPGG